MLDTTSLLAGFADLMPDTQAVSYAALDTDGLSFATAATVLKAERRPVGTRDVMGPVGAQFTAAYAVWHLWTAQLAGVTPKPGDKFTDASSVVWYVMQGGANLELQGQRWRLVCNKQLTDT